MKATRIISACEKGIFSHRRWVIGLFVLLSGFLLFQATQLKLDASFSKNIPLQHPYMQTYMKYQKDFGGANSILVAVCDKKGTIFNQTFFDTLKKVHDDLYFIPGVDRSQVSSLFAPSTRFTEVVEDGFAGGPVIPSNFNSADPAALQTVHNNIIKAGIVGRMVSDDFSCSMVSARLMEKDPQTGAKLDTIGLAHQLESKIRDKYQSDEIGIHIIGFAKMIGDVADGAKSVLLFFALALLITAVFVYLFCKSVKKTLLILLCSFISVVWQLGLLHLLGFGLDPMSILVPFLIFAIGVSHGVQMINAIGKEVRRGRTVQVASQFAFVTLALPGGIALLSDTVGFLTLLVIDIGIIRELAIAASIGVAAIILTNLILLPVLTSYIHLDERYVARFSQNENNGNKLWWKLSVLADRKVAAIVLLASVVLFVVGFIQSRHMQIGDLGEGAAALHADSRYNKDTALITDKFEITVDYMSVLVKTSADACTSYPVMQAIDDFQWKMTNVKGVQSAVSLASIVKQVNAGYNEGNPKWHILPRNQSSLAQAVSRVPTSTGLRNGDCSVMPVILFLQDHKAGTIEKVVAAVKRYRKEYQSTDVTFLLASGPVGVMAATNEAVKAAQYPMMGYVFAAVILLCLISFRSIKATLVVVVPLYVVSILAQALMTHLNIGLTVSTLPVIALGVGIGVDYGIYILSTMNFKLKHGMAVREAYYQALQERGSAVLFTAITLAVGVSTWVFSALKFQVDMGILLTFMFVVNMLGAVIILPALAAFLWRTKQPRQ